jgi:chloramphenicol-sensitive protein RarD
MQDASHSDAGQRSGVIFGLLAFSMWGIFPVYFKWIESVAPLEVLGHRVLWAVPFGALILTFRRQWREVRGALVDRRMLTWLALAALCISLNWLIYIWAVQNGRILETSLGYYINPLVFVAVGTIVFAERLRRFQVVAVGLATTGVLVLAVSGGVFPWVALSLASLFAAYGIIRKQIAIGAMPGLFIETSMLLPLAAAWIAWLAVQGNASITSGGAALASLLVLGGPVTVLPLLCFAIAAKRVSLTAIGFMQFLAPSMQFALGLYYGEPLTLAHKICFACIWAAVGFFVYDAVAGNKEAEPG